MGFSDPARVSACCLFCHQSGCPLLPGHVMEYWQFKQFSEKIRKKTKQATSECACPSPLKSCDFYWLLGPVMSHFAQFKPQDKTRGRARVRQCVCMLLAYTSLYRSFLSPPTRGSNCILSHLSNTKTVVRWLSGQSLTSGVDTPYSPRANIRTLKCDCPLSVRVCTV